MSGWHRSTSRNSGNWNAKERPPLKLFACDCSHDGHSDSAPSTARITMAYLFYKKKGKKLMSVFGKLVYARPKLPIAPRKRFEAAAEHTRALAETVCLALGSAYQAIRG